MTPARLAAVACAVAFAGLTWAAVAADGPTAFDAWVREWVLAHRVSWLTSTVRALTVAGSAGLLVPVCLVAGGLFAIRGRGWTAPALLLLALFGTILLKDVAKSLTDRPRPPMADWLADVSDSAYPSGHAAESLAVLLSLVLLFRVGRSTRVRAVGWGAAATAVLLVGASRVYLGVHWTTDVLGGWALAAAWVAAAWWGTAAVRLRGGRARSGPCPPGLGP